MRLPADIPTTKRTKIVEELREGILTGKFARGAHLQQDELAEHFESSITPVREALRILEAEGMVISEPHRGVRVAPLALDKVTATYVVRRLVEGYAMQRATRQMSRRDLAEARRLLAEEDTLRQDMDTQAIRELNHRFHFFFYDRIGMPALADEIRSLWQSFPWDMLLSAELRSAESHLEHEAILNAVENGDLEEVRSRTEAHITNGFRAIMRHLEIADGPRMDPFDLDSSV